MSERRKRQHKSNQNELSLSMQSFSSQNGLESEEKCINILGRISVKSQWISIQFFLLDSLGRRENDVHVGGTKTPKFALRFGLKVDFTLFTELQTSSETQPTQIKHLLNGYLSLF